MLTLLRERVGAQVVHVVATDRTDGDVHPQLVDASVLQCRQRAVTGGTWVMLDQVHGIDIHRAQPGDDRAATAGDGDVLVVDDELDAAIWAADCAAVWLYGASGRRVGFHAGWRGLAAGVIDVAVTALDEPAVCAVLGPCIHPCCYEFGEGDLGAVAAGVGVAPDDLSAVTTSGGLALDVRAAVRRGLSRHGITLDVTGPCTGCDSRWFSHRTRRDTGRHALVSRIDA